MEAALTVTTMQTKDPNHPTTTIVVVVLRVLKQAQFRLKSLARRALITCGSNLVKCSLVRRKKVGVVGHLTEVAFVTGKAITIETVGIEGSTNVREETACKCQEITTNQTDNSNNHLSKREDGTKSSITNLVTTLPQGSTTTTLRQTLTEAPIQ